MKSSMRALLVAAALLQGLFLAGGRAAGQDSGTGPTGDHGTTTTQPEPSTETTVAPPGATTTTLPADVTTTTLPADVTTTTTLTEVVPSPTVAEPVDDGDHHLDDDPPPPGPWDLVRPSDAALAWSLSERADAAAFLETARAELSEAEAALAAAQAALADLGDREQQSVERYRKTLQRFHRRVMAAYVTGAPSPFRLPALGSSVADQADRVVLSGAVTDADRKLANLLRSQQQKISADARAAAERLSAAQASVDVARRTVAAAEQRLAAADAALVTPPTSIAGFVFPVAGPHSFISSFGFCRDGCQRLHQGNDIFAVRDTPVVAVEDGWIERMGTNRLGGIILWLRGRSGYRYYYAHLEGYAPGIAPGQWVTVGTHLGGVGDTGNAVGTPPHLHFEIHPGVAPAIDPYLILRGAPVLDRPMEPALTVGP